MSGYKDTKVLITARHYDIETDRIAEYQVSRGIDLPNPSEEGIPVHELRMEFEKFLALLGLYFGCEEDK